MEKFKTVLNKITDILEIAIGYSLMICLIVGGLGGIAYIVAFIIGGDLAANICEWLYKSFYSFLIKLSTITTFTCFVLMYLKGNAKWAKPLKYWKNKFKTNKEKK